MINHVFDPDADQRRFQQSIRAAAPRQTYAILFTPRSGSSWLTSVLSQTRAMGTPAEWFNPQLMPSSSRAKGARDLDQFIEAISRHEIHGGIFGFEATYHQIIAVFGDKARFTSRFRESAFFWLIRKDIVAQGVSLDKMMQTKVSHAANSDTAEIAKSDAAYRYDPRGIRHWITHIHAAETGTEKMIAEFGLTPACLSYEWITASGAGQVVGFFARHLGLNVPEPTEITSPHRKIGTSKNSEFAERFRAENRDFLESIQEQRAGMLSRLAVTELQPHETP